MDEYSVLLLSKSRVPGKWVEYNARPYTLDHARFCVKKEIQPNYQTLIVPWEACEATLMLLNGEHIPKACNPHVKEA